MSPEARGCHASIAHADPGAGSVSDGRAIRPSLTLPAPVLPARHASAIWRILRRVPGGHAMFMDGLLIATGFTGALTVAWFIRLLTRSAAPDSGVSVHFGPAAAEAIAQH